MNAGRGKMIENYLYKMHETLESLAPMSSIHILQTGSIRSYLPCAKVMLTVNITMLSECTGIRPGRRAACASRPRSCRRATRRRATIVAAAA